MFLEIALEHLKQIEKFEDWVYVIRQRLLVLPSKEDGIKSALCSSKKPLKDKYLSFVEKYIRPGSEWHVENLDVQRRIRGLRSKEVSHRELHLHVSRSLSFDEEDFDKVDPEITSITPSTPEGVCSTNTDGGSTCGGSTPGIIQVIPTRMGNKKRTTNGGIITRTTLTPMNITAGTTTTPSGSCGNEDDLSKLSGNESGSPLMATRSREEDTSILKDIVEGVYNTIIDISKRFDAMFIRFRDSGVEFVFLMYPLHKHLYCHFLGNY